MISRWETSARMLLGVGAMAALIAAGCGRANREAGGKEVIATVGREQITRADLERRMSQLDENVRSSLASPERQAEFLNYLVEEKLLRLDAEKRGLDRDPQFMALMEDARQQLLVRALSEKVLVPMAQPDSAEIARYYAENPAEFKVPEQASGRQIVVASESEARALRRLLLRGASFDSLVTARSIDPQTRNLGGAIGFVQRGSPVRGLGVNDAFVQAVMAVPEGQISEPIRTAKGYHLVKVESHSPERVRDLASMRDALARKLVPSKFQALRRRIVDSLRAAYPVKVDTLALLGDEAYRSAQAKELFDRAQNTEDPTARLKIYEQILSQHGETKYAAQAQFMIGFVYAEELKDKERARTALTAVIERYPNSELVDSARWMLKNMDAQPPIDNARPSQPSRGGSGSD